MTSLLWTYEHADQYSCETKTLRLIVMPANIAGVFRFMVLKQLPASSAYTPVASGHRITRQGAMDAAEIEARRLETAH